MPTYVTLPVMLILWHLKLVDTFSMVQFMANVGLQYGAYTTASTAVTNLSEIDATFAIKPVLGFRTAYNLIKAANTTAIRREKIATVACFVAGSITTAVSGNPAANGAYGTLLSALVNQWELDVLRMRGGAQVLSPSLIKTPVVSLLRINYQVKFQENSKQIIQTIFREQTARRYAQRAIPKVISPAYIVPIVSTQLPTTTLIGSTCLGFIGGGLIVFGGFCLFKAAEGKRYQNDKILIDVTDSIN